MSTTTSNRLYSWLIILLALLLYLPIYGWLWGEWFSNPFYSHGPLVLLVALVIGWRRSRGVSGRPNRWGLAVMAAGLAIYVVSLIRGIPFISALSLIPVLLGLITYFWGAAVSRRMIFPAVFLLFMIPLPFTLVEQSTLGLQFVATRGSAIMAGLIGLDVTQTGGGIFLADSALVVGAQCSGMRSMVTLLALATLMAFVLQGRWWARLSLIILAVPVAVAANVVRITSLLWVIGTLGDEIGLNFYHDWSSPLLFLLALGFLILVSWIMGCREIRSDI